MTNQQTFQTTRLSVRPRTRSDLQACLAMDRDPEVTEFIPGPWADLERHEAFVRERIEADFGPGLGYWSIFEREQPDRFLGWVFLIPYDGVGPDIEIGWRFVREAWGNGFATEAAKIVLEHAFQTVGLHRVVADIDPRNEGSIRVATKIGMTEMACRKHNDTPWRSFAITARTDERG